MAVIPFEPLLFGNAANNGRMLGEMDARSPIVSTITEIAHVLTGRSELKARKKPGLGGILPRCAVLVAGARRDDDAPLEADTVVDVLPPFAGG